MLGRKGRALTATAKPLRSGRTLCFGWFALRERRVTRGVFVLTGPDGTRVTYRGGFSEWRRFWRFYCLGKGWQHCDQDPLWPSRKRPVKRVEIAYMIDLLREPQYRSPVVAVDANHLLKQLAREDARR